MSAWRDKLSVFSQRKYYLAPFWRTGLLLPSQQFLGSCTGEQNRMWNTVSSLVVQQMFYMWSSFLTTTNFRNCFSLCNKSIFLNIISFRFYENQSCKCDFGKPCIVHINIWVQRGRMVNLDWSYFRNCWLFNHVHITDLQMVQCSEWTVNESNYLHSIGIFEAFCSYLNADKRKSITLMQNVFAVNIYIFSYFWFYTQFFSKSLIFKLKWSTLKRQFGWNDQFDIL